MSVQGGSFVASSPGSNLTDPETGASVTQRVDGSSPSVRSTDDRLRRALEAMFLHLRAQTALLKSIARAQNAEMPPESLEAPDEYPT